MSSANSHLQPIYESLFHQLCKLFENFYRKQNDYYYYYSFRNDAPQFSINYDNNNFIITNNNNSIVLNLYNGKFSSIEKKYITHFEKCVQNIFFDINIKFKEIILAEIEKLHKFDHYTIFFASKQKIINFQIYISTDGSLKP